MKAKLLNPGGITDEMLKASARPDPETAAKLRELNAAIDANLEEQKRLTVFVTRRHPLDMPWDNDVMPASRSDQDAFAPRQRDLFGESAPPESSGPAVTSASPAAAPEPGTLLDCAWCAAAPAVVTLYGWRTCSACAGSRAERIRAYQRRLKIAAKEK